MGAALTPLIAAGGKVGSSLIDASASDNAANAQMNAALRGTQAQYGLARDTYNTDLTNNYNAGQWLKDYMPEFDMTKQSAPSLPNLPDPTQYFGDAKTNQYYDTAQSNLNNQMQSSIGNAQSSFGANAASRGLANPSAGMAMVGNQTAQSFIPQFGQLEQNRAGALLGNQQNLYNAQFQTGQANYSNQMSNANFNSQQNEILNSLRQLGYGNKANFAQQYGNPNMKPTYFGGTNTNNSGTGSMYSDSNSPTGYYDPNTEQRQYNG